MIFGGLMKLTLLDYPEKVACTLFTLGCNLRCPFCHNATLVTGHDVEHLTEEEVLAFLDKRKHVLEGMCLTGGEPLINNVDEIAAFLTKVKALGYLVKLDTNGFFPEKLQKLVSSGLVDYVAMDVKKQPFALCRNGGLCAGSCGNATFGCLSQRRSRSLRIPYDGDGQSPRRQVGGRTGSVAALGQSAVSAKVCRQR